MWRAVLRSMYSSGLKPLTSAAILVSKFVVSKRVMRPTPETPSTMFDHTVSMSFPIGVMKPMPVTATRRPLWLDVMASAYGRGVESTPASGGKTWMNLRTSCPNPISEHLLEVERELEPEAGRRHVEVATEQLLQLLEPVQDRVPVEPQGRRGVLDGALGQVRLEGLQQLLPVADLVVHEPAQAVGHEPLGKQRVLGENQLRDHFVVAVHEGIRPELAPSLKRLLGLKVGPRHAMESWVIAADSGPPARAQLAGPLFPLPLHPGP